MSEPQFHATKIGAQFLDGVRIGVITIAAELQRMNTLLERIAAALETTKKEREE